ncbi:repressor of RNA polymerase III transcription MAF1 [Pelomyxa schiedti]|nr:repressor of RNA polymerase III transcription MAF1 [Pelomyxa schiedti]
MKFLSLPSLVEINELLSNVVVSDTVLHAFIQAFSCKKAGSEKKLYQSLHSKWFQEERPKGVDVPSALVGSPPPSLTTTPPFSTSPTLDRDFLEMQSGKTTYFNLLSTLNATFPDYDFSDERPEAFTRETMPHEAINNINASLASVPDYLPVVGPKLWSVIDREVSLSHCEIYTYHPDEDSGPFSEPGTLWSFNYFFFNKSLKRILFFCCWCKSRSSTTESMAEDSEPLQFDDETDF